MKTKHLSLAGLLVAGALACVLVLAGCDNGTDPGGGGGDGDGGGDKTYVLGDTGPGGGKIFYVSGAGFTVYTSASDTVGVTAHYLEAAPSDISGGKKWSSSSTYDNHHLRGTETGIGTGLRNTLKIYNVDNGDNAANACKNLTTGGKSDWYLPSKDELNALYTNQSYVENLGTSKYWSSSHSDTFYDGAWCQHFGSDSQGEDHKYSTNSVRAVRAF